MPRYGVGVGGKLHGIKSIAGNRVKRYFVARPRNAFAVDLNDAGGIVEVDG